MPKYTVINRSNSQISLIIPAYHRVNSIPLVIQPSRSVDILPYAGSIKECRRIAYLKELSVRGLIEIIEESDG